MQDPKIPQIKPEENEVNLPAKPSGWSKVYRPSFMEVPLGQEESVNTEKNIQPEFTGKNTVFKKPLLSRKFKKILLIAFLIILVINIGFGLNIFVKSQKLRNAINNTRLAVSSRDYEQLKKTVKDTNESFKEFRSAYLLVTWLRIIPFIGSYVSDGVYLSSAGLTGFEVIDTFMEIAEPYVDLIGFSGSGSVVDQSKTAAERMDFIVQTVPAIVPKLDEISVSLDKIEKDLAHIKPERYPQTIFGFKLRENIQSLITLFQTSNQFLHNGKPMLVHLPYLLGLDTPRKYLVLFQNDKELRPTGGFITAYSLMTVDKAKFNPVESDDIYNLDGKYKPVIEAPEPIIKYIKGPYILSKKLRLRDMNWNPDFPSSMKTFLDEVSKIGISDVDGVIAVDTQLLVNLLDVIGPIGVSGFGNFSNEIIEKCNCPQVIYELEDFADVEGPVVWDPAGTGKIIYAPPNMDNRKKIIGPLMNSILANAFAQPKSKFPKLAEAAYKSLLEKHVLIYVKDENIQQALESFGVAGVIKSDGFDYLFINDANLGGRKSNLYVSQEINQKVDISKDGTVTKTLEITYKNPEKYDGWLNSVLPNWVRIYVPQGSELISFDGVTDRVDPYTEFNKTVFAGYFELRPEGVVNLNLTYKLPTKIKSLKDYRLYIQKQPGKDKPLYEINLNKNNEEFYLKEDRWVEF